MSLIYNQSHHGPPPIFARTVLAPRKKDRVLLGLSRAAGCHLRVTEMSHNRLTTRYPVEVVHIEQLLDRFGGRLELRLNRMQMWKSRDVVCHTGRATL